MMTVAFLFLIVAVVLFLLAAVNIPSSRVNLGWLGMVFFAGSFLVERLQ